MAQGPSGRIVLEIDVALKRSLYSVLAERGTTLKDWFTSAAAQYVEQHGQPPLPLPAAASNTPLAPKPNLHEA